MPRNPDAIALLKKDHAEVKKLLQRLDSSHSAAERGKLFGRIHKEVKVHSAVEEEIFYPAFREAVKAQEDRKLYFEAKEEHHVVDGVLAELQGADPASEVFAAKAKVLMDLIEHHAEEEEEEMFPRARKLIDRAKLVELGVRMAERKKALLGLSQAA